MISDFFYKFLKESDGAVTVDFVVLTGAICLLGFIVVTTVNGGATTFADDIEGRLDNIDLP